MGAARLLLKNVGEWAVKTGEHPPTIEGAVSRNDCQLAIVRVDASFAARRIDDPHQLRSGVEPLPDLGQQLTWSIVRRDNLRNEIGSEIRVSAPRNPIGVSETNERQVWRSDGVGIRPDLESRFLEDQTELAPVYVVAKQIGEPRGDIAMPSTRRLANEEAAVYELGGLARDVHLLKLLGRKEMRNRISRHSHSIALPFGGCNSAAEVGWIRIGKRHRFLAAEIVLAREGWRLGEAPIERICVVRPSITSW